MSSRFTETDKWKDPWFRKLSPNAKVLFEYLRDACDSAGFWEVDLDLASYFTGIPKASDDSLFKAGPNGGIEAAFEELSRCYIAANSHIYIKKFLLHQKNLPLNINNPAHRGIIAKINSHNSFGKQVLAEIDRQIQEKGLHSPIGKGNSKGNSNLSKGGVGENLFDEFWKVYPRKVAKGAARKAWAQLGPDEVLGKTIIAAITSQAKTKGAEWSRENFKYCPHASTWLNQERWNDEIKEQTNGNARIQTTASKTRIYRENTEHAYPDEGTVVNV